MMRVDWDYDRQWLRKYWMKREMKYMVRDMLAGNMQCKSV